MAIDLVGRGEEIAELDRFLDVVLASGPGALVLEGPAGIGKSTLWSAARERARAGGFLVLDARPSEAEATFAFQALGDLLEPVQAELAAIPAPQRRSLEVALLRADPSDESTVELQTVATAASNVIRSAASRRPLLIAIDDAPWLDRASATVIEFIVRRLSDRRVGLLVTQRVDRPGPAPLELERAMPTEVLWLGPLGRAQLHVLLASRLGLVLSRASLARLHEVSQGNPFHAIEIARALQGLPSMPRPGDPLPIPESVRGLIGERLAVLTDDTRRVLLVAALAGSPSLGLVRAALGIDAAAFQHALDAAVDAGLVVVDAATIRFAHPLIASTVVSAADASRRRDAHRALAAVVGEPEARGRHLALSTGTPDHEVAQALEAAATDAERRGATETAVDLHRLAVDLTPESEPAHRDRRRVRLAMALVLVADLAVARDILDETIPRLPPGPLRAEACLTRATVSWYAETSPDAVRHMEAALRALGRDPDDEPTVPDDPAVATLLGRIYLRLGQYHEDMVTSRGYRLAAVKLLEHHGARTSYATALMMLFYADANLGEPVDEAVLEHALRVEEGGHEDSSTLPGFWWMHTDRPDLARERFLWMRRTGEEIGEHSGEADVATQLAQVEVFADDWPRARAYIEEARMLAAQEGHPDRAPVIRARALLDAHEGRLDEGEAAASAGAARAFADGSTIVGVAFLQILAFIAASRGDASRVLELTGESRRWLDSIRFVDAFRMDPLAERAEALVALRRLDEAAAALAEMERREAVVHRPWLEAAIARTRSLLALALGDDEVAIGATEGATDDRARAWRSFDRARTLFVRGQVLRQLRRPREAGLALDASLEIFDRLGARAWADRARSEARRLGRRRSASDELTPSEGQVAALAASGLRNHEVAARLGVSPKTVEAHLARIYSKLGIRSRAELGRAIHPDEARQPAHVGNHLM